MVLPADGSQSGGQEDAAARAAGHGGGVHHSRLLRQKVRLQLPLPAHGTRRSRCGRLAVAAPMSLLPGRHGLSCEGRHMLEGGRSPAGHSKAQSGSLRHRRAQCDMVALCPPPSHAGHRPKGSD